LIDLNLTKLQDEKLFNEKKETILNDWKEAARRLENVFLYVSSLTIILFPFVLFGKFYFKDYNENNFNLNKCGCDF